MASLFFILRVQNFILLVNRFSLRLFCEKTIDTLKINTTFAAVLDS